MVSQIKAPFRYIDLFAGIGGFAAALEAFGGQNVYSVEKDADAAAVYSLNWKHDPLGDITTDANEQVMKVNSHDVLVAGFPCQPFSKSGAQKGMEETRGTLYFNILQIIKKHHPSIVILENVRNLYGPRHMHEWDVIIQTLRDENYLVSDKPAILSPHQLPKSLGGRPQIRERVFITATYTPHIDVEKYNPEPVATSKQIFRNWNPGNWDILHDLPLDKNADNPDTKLSKHEIFWLEAWDDWVKLYRKLNKGENPPGFPIWVDSWIDLADLAIPEGTPQWKRNFLTKNAELYSRHKEQFDKWIEKHKVRSDLFPQSRRKLEWQAQDTPSLWDGILHFRPSGIRVKKANYAPALVAITQTSVIGKLRRRISTTEAKRLQGFPEWFDFGDQTSSATYKQLGNGVNIGVVWNILKLHVERDAKHLSKTPSGRSLLKAVMASPESPDEILRKFRK